MQLDQIIVKMLTHEANREQCLAVMESTDGDLRAHSQARLKVLDGIQKQAQFDIYMRTPAGMVDTWDIRDWYVQEYGYGNIHHIDFHAIADGKKNEWYAHVNATIENNL